MSKLYFRYGAMNSSKTAQLIMVHHNYTEQGKNVIVFKPELDTRSDGVVRSRALSQEVNAITVPKHASMWMLPMIMRTLYETDLDCILVDEAQFLTAEQIDELGKITDLTAIPVICYGLATDFQGQLFEGSKRLFEIADKKEEIKTVCVYCNRKALFNMRTVGDIPVFDGDQVAIGGNESYKPVCRTCFYDKKRNSHKEGA